MASNFHRFFLRGSANYRYQNLLGVIYPFNYLTARILISNYYNSDINEYRLKTFSPLCTYQFRNRYSGPAWVWWTISLLQKKNENIPVSTNLMLQAWFTSYFYLNYRWSAIPKINAGASYLILSSS